MAVLWDEELATGIELIDNQHKEIFRRVDVLLNACKARKGKTEVGEILNFLEDYIVEHFEAEENIQVHFKYPGYAAHKGMHDGFIKDVDRLREQFEREGPSLMMVVNTSHVVVDWLVKHIRKVDKALAEFLKTHGYKEPV